MVHRFLHSGSLQPGEIVSLEGAEVHHAVRVRRLQAGEMVELFDGKGHVVTARVESVDRSSGLSVRVIGPIGDVREPSVTIDLCLALIHPDRFELALQKGTELGISSFYPLRTRRSEVPPERARGKLERWRRILAEAAKQSGRSRIPELHPVTELEEALNFSAVNLFLDAEASPDSLPREGNRFSILVGPEGGWEPSEVELACSHGAHLVRLGPRRLRAETAAIAAATLVGNRYGDLT